MLLADLLVTALHSIICYVYVGKYMVPAALQQLVFESI